MTSDPTQDPARKLHHIGYELLGPVMMRWLLALHQHISFFDAPDTRVLFCARAGVRIDRLYRLFLEQRAGTPKGDILWVSRVSICKGTFGRNPRQTSDLIGREYHDRPLHELITGLLRHNPEQLAGLDLDRPELKALGTEFPGWIDGPSREAKALRAYLTACGTAFDSYMAETLGGARRAVLVDSGWQGTAQSLLASAYHEVDWKGLYFGRMLGAPGLHRDPADAIGLMFETPTYDPDQPESAFALHRHIIESILEPNGPSVEEIPANPFLHIAEAMIEGNLSETPAPDDDALFLMVEAYIRDHSGQGMGQILACHQQAMAELARIITFPTRDEALTLSCKDRSADFGKSISAPVLLDKDDPVYETTDARVQNALWSQGQIALELSPGMAREMQGRAAGLSDGLSYFDPIAAAEADVPGDTRSDPAEGRVAIITRTKNRPLLLKRAADSVASQSYETYTWVVVNDGGSRDEVEAVIAASAVDLRNVVLVSHDASLGMEAASNSGIAASESEFVVIHDDDDSWEPDFLKTTVEFLQSTGGQRYGGVITESLYISEEIDGDAVITHGKAPYQGWVRSVHLAEMACGNFFAPISFLFRRSVYDRVGGYNENLPVLGDWFFNLEFLLTDDIGMIHEPLANYHHRDRGDSSKAGVYSNSVSAGRDKHQEFNAVVRNEFLRRHGSDTSAALAIVMGYMEQDVRHRLGALGGDRADAGGGGARHVSQSPNGEALDRAERHFLIAHLNYAYPQASLLRRLVKQVRRLPAEADWPAILAAYDALRLDLPCPSSFAEDEYQRRFPDVASAIAQGKLSSGFEHFIRYGKAEGRSR